MDLRHSNLIEMLSIQSWLLVHIKKTHNYFFDAVNKTVLFGNFGIFALGALVRSMRSNREALIAGCKQLQSSGSVTVRLPNFCNLVMGFTIKKEKILKTIRGHSSVFFLKNMGTVAEKISTYY